MADREYAQFVLPRAILTIIKGSCFKDTQQVKRTPRSEYQVRRNSVIITSICHSNRNKDFTWSTSVNTSTTS